MNNKQTTKCTGKGIRITLCRSSDDSLRTFTEHEIENGKVQEWSGQCDVFIAEQYNQANNYEKQPTTKCTLDCYRRYGNSNKYCTSCTGTGTAETVSEDKRNFARVRRSSDNAELDFTWQDIIKGKVLNWVNKNGTADGFVAIEYNPSGNGNDIVHTTVVHQPRLVTSGVLNTLNGKPALEKAYEPPNYGCEYSSSCTGTTNKVPLKQSDLMHPQFKFKQEHFEIEDCTGTNETTLQERNVLKPMEERFYDEYRHIQHIKNEESGNTYKPIIDFIKQEIALAVQQERERICKLITNDNTKQFEGFLVIGTYKEHIIKAINKDL